MAKYILSIDQGTTSSRALIIAQTGEVISMAQKEFKQHFPQAGWVEHDPQEIWSSEQAVIYESLAKASLHLNDIEAIGITNQRETTICWDRKTSKPLYNAIVWQDRRTTPLCQQMKKEGHEGLIRKKTGLLLDPYFSGSKLRWILDNVPGARERAERGELAFGTVDTWLIWKLTGGKVHVTDVTNASRTLLFNIETLTWDEELLKLFHIPASLLPEVKSSSEVVGTTDEGIPIAGIAGDQQAALIGQACFRSGQGKITYGTGCFILINTGSALPKQNPHLLTTIGYKIQDKLAYAIEGSVFIGGAVVQWLRDNLKIIKQSREVEVLAQSVEDNGGVYFVPAFTGLGAPYWDPFARGTIVGLTRGTTAAHIARAALEGIAFQVADVLDLVHFPIKEFKVDGGAARNDMIMDLQASLQDIPLIRPTHTEVTAMGAAFLAGLAVGYWKSLEEIEGILRADKTFTRTIHGDRLEMMRGQWKRAIQAAEAWHEAE